MGQRREVSSMCVVYHTVCSFVSGGVALRFTSKRQCSFVWIMTLLSHLFRPIETTFCFVSITLYAPVYIRIWGFPYVKASLQLSLWPFHEYRLLF